MRLLYPRTIQVRRLRRDVTPAVLANFEPDAGYVGSEQNTVSDDPNSELVLYKNVCCSIAAHQSGRTKDGLVPTDATMKPLWLIIVPASSCVPKAAIRDRDLLVDDEQYRYIVAQAWWTPLSWNLSAVRLEA
jgi:hypothetical protein